MKMQRLLVPILVVATCASAQAAVPLVSLPRLPLSLPSGAVPAAVTLPGRTAFGAVVLPSPLAPLGPVTLPSMPVPLPWTRPGVTLPGPKPLPLMPTTLAAVSQEKPVRQGEKLDQIYDGRATRRPFKIQEDELHTIPEHDLIREIGIDSY